MVTESNPRFSIVHNTDTTKNKPIAQQSFIFLKVSLNLKDIAVTTNSKASVIMLFIVWLKYGILKTVKESSINKTVVYLIFKLTFILKIHPYIKY